MTPYAIYKPGKITNTIQGIGRILGGWVSFHALGAAIRLVAPIAYALAAEFLLTIGFALATSVGVPGRAAGFVFVCASLVVLIVTLGNIAGKPTQAP